METVAYLEILQKEIHSTVFATVDKDGLPVTCVIDIMLADENGLYFLTAKGKAFYRRLMQKEYVSISGMKGEGTMNTIAVSLRGKVKCIKKNRLVEIFEKNPYMAKIYKSKESREALEVFQLYEGEGELFDLSVLPPRREAFSIGNTRIQKAGYYITDSCMGCQNCYKKCPIGCIEKGAPFHIIEENCIRCGNCYFVCPFHAVEKYE